MHPRAEADEAAVGASLVDGEGSRDRQTVATKRRSTNANVARSGLVRC